MKVTRVLCDRCQREIDENVAEHDGLEMRLTYEPRGRDPSLLDRLKPFGSTHHVDLCPECRDAFADWLGDQGRHLPDLAAPDEPEETDEEKPNEALAKVETADADVHARPV